MSNDLISRSALLESLNEFCGQQRYLVPENVWDMIEKTPTAYDVDKVVEQLEEKRAIAFLTLANTGKADYDLASQEVSAYIDSIAKIIKAGGVNEDCS